MADFYAVTFATPAGGEEIGNEAAMAFFGPGLGTQQGEVGVPACGVERLRNASIFHEGEEFSFVSRPVLRFAIRLEEFGRGCEMWLMHVSDAGDFLQEIGEVRMLGVAGELAAAVLANVDELLDSCLLDEGKKFLRCFSSKSDGAKEILHGAQKYSIASGEVRKANSSACRRRASSRAEARSETKSAPLVKAEPPCNSSKRSSASDCDSRMPLRRICTGTTPRSTRAGQIMRKR